MAPREEVAVIPPDAVTLTEAAKLLTLDEVTLSHLAEDRQVPAIKVDGQWMFSRKSLQKWQRLRGSGAYFSASDPGSPGRRDSDVEK
ncbi:MAG TPA: helix-turn-helix domain-containing protein [Methylomirabilota bacterium]|nr:helix-turn-helix domain-containing protein [Methylomirabilota bacterium]